MDNEQESNLPSETVLSGKVRLCMLIRNVLIPLVYIKVLKSKIWMCKKRVLHIRSYIVFNYQLANLRTK